MTQELIDLRNSIMEGSYTDALAIVDELEGMSKQAILRNIQSYLRILLIHLIKNQIEQRLTNVIIPNPHEGDISVGLLSRLLRQAGVSREEWLRE